MSNDSLTSGTVTVERTCRTCGHRSGPVTGGKCMYSGFYIETERKYPTQCDQKFSGWSPRSGFIARIRQFWSGTK